MSAKISVETEVNTGNTESQMDKLLKKMDQFIDSTQASMEATEKAAKEASEAAKKAGTSINGLSKGFKGLGLAMKGAGIGIVLKGLQLLQEVFMSNQRVADLFATAMGTVTGVFNQFIGPVVDSVEQLTKMEGSFDAILKVGKSLLTIVFTPLRLAFKGIQAGVLAAQLAWEESFLGSGDQKRILELRQGLEEVKQDVEDIALESVQAGQAVIDNFSEAVSEVGNAFTAVKDGIVKGYEEIDVAQAKQDAAHRTRLENQARLDAVIQQGIRERADRDAEIQRQIRDDTTRTFEERIAANKELGRILDEQEQNEKAAVATRLQAAEELLKLDQHNIDAQVAKQEALNELAAIEAQQAGFRSEQLLNEIALEKEQAEALDQIDKELFEKESKRLDEKVRKRKETASKEEAIEKAKADAISDTIDKGFASAALLAEESAETSKFVAAAEATFSTYAAIAAQLKTAAGSPGGAIPGYAIAQAIATGAFGFLQVKKILSTDVGSASGGNAGGGGGGGVGINIGNPYIQTEFNDPLLPGIDGTSNFGNTDQEAPPIRAFVTQTDIKESGALARNIDDRGKI